MTTVWRIFRFTSMVLLAYLWVGVQTVKAQVQLPPLVKAQWFDVNGRPLANGCLFTYISGTNTPLVTFTDFTGGTSNPNPIVLDGSGREPFGTDIWLGSGSYRFKLVSQGGVNCASGVQQWVEDGITTAFGTILSSNNVWTGTNTFNGPSIFNGAVTMNVGFTSNGPSNLTAGGSLVGTFSGSPIFSGVPNFSSGFNATTGTFSGQIISNVLTGTAPITVASTTVVPNLNASLLVGCVWASPCPIGITTPNIGVFTALTATSVFSLGGGTNQTATQGTDTTLLTSGTFTGGTGSTICKDANGGATTIGCATSGFTKIEGMSFCPVGCTVTGTPCSTGAGANATCVNAITWPTAFVDSNYTLTCTGLGVAAGFPFIPYTTSKSSTGVIVTTSNGQGSAAMISAVSEIDCSGIHP
jgi:hypothetical protein